MRSFHILDTWESLKLYIYKIVLDETNE